MEAFATSADAQPGSAFTLQRTQPSPDLIRDEIALLRRGQDAHFTAVDLKDGTAAVARDGGSLVYIGLSATTPDSLERLKQTEAIRSVLSKLARTSTITQPFVRSSVARRDAHMGKLLLAAPGLAAPRGKKELERDSVLQRIFQASGGDHVSGSTSADQVIQLPPASDIAQSIACAGIPMACIGVIASQAGEAEAISNYLRPGL